MDNGLNDQQREFCRLVVAGQLSHGKAYRQAYQRDDSTSDAACRKAASRLLQKEEIREYCDTLRGSLDAIRFERSTVAEAEESLAILRQRINEKSRYE